MNRTCNSPKGGLHDYEIIADQVQQFIDLVVSGIKKGNEDIMGPAQELEDSIDRMREEMRGNYIMRLQSGLCTVDPGLILVDMLTSFEKIVGLLLQHCTGGCRPQIVPYRAKGCYKMQEKFLAGFKTHL